MTTKRVSARTAAETLLAQRAYSSQGLYGKLLEKGFEERESAAAIARLAELGYLDDAEYARNLSASLKKRGYGERRVRQTLIAKGIDGETATEILEGGADGEGEGEADAQIDKWLAKLNKGRPLDRKERARLSAALFRRGFSGEEIQRGLRRFDKDGGDDL